MGNTGMKKTLAENNISGEDPPPAYTPEPPPPSKALLGAVIIMGVLIIVGVVLLLWVVVHRIQHHKDMQSLPAAPVIASAPAITMDRKGRAAPLYHDILAPPATLNLVARPNEHIHSLTARDDGSVAVTLKTKDGNERVLIWIPEQARISAELDVKPAPETPFSEKTEAPKAPSGRGETP